MIVLLSYEIVVVILFAITLYNSWTLISMITLTLRICGGNWFPPLLSSFNSNPLVFLTIKKRDSQKVNLKTHRLLVPTVSNYSPPSIDSNF